MAVATRVSCGHAVDSQPFWVSLLGTRFCLGLAWDPLCTVSHDRPPYRPASFQHSRSKTKALKALDAKHNYVLGRDVMMDRVYELYRRALIGRLEYCTMTEDEWIDWATINWKPLINYIPIISLLANKWIFFVFIEKTDANCILNNRWTIQKGSLVVSR